jgi:hypothetical protein
MIRRLSAYAVLFFIAGLLIAGAIANVARSTAGPVGIAMGALMALCVWVLWSRADIELLLRALDTLRAVLPLVAFTVVATMVGSSRGTVAFDEMGAQIIVVLLLALAIDARFFRLRAGKDRLDLAATFSRWLFSSLASTTHSRAS